jgi:DNA-binding LacI/PurR family transcriptional regulator
MITSPTKVDKTDPIPRYLQVRKILEEAIRSGQYGPGARLPGEREIARSLNVSQMTVNKAVLALVQDGWLLRETGNGTFVRPDFRPPAPTILRLGFAVPTSAQYAQEDFYLGSLLQGIQRAITNEPVNLTILETSPASLYDRLREAPVDGCLLTDVLDGSYADIQNLVAAGKKIVLIGADREQPPAPCVDSDNYGGARAAVEHLIDLGHRRIAGVFAYKDRCNTRDRWRGYEDALHAHDITVPAEYIVVPPEYVHAFADADPQPEPRRNPIRELLGRDSRPTAFFCGGYYIALEVMKTLQEAGLRIPADVSVVGFDDPGSARYLSPALTTLHQPLEEMGWRATSKLLEWLRNHEEPPRHDILPASLKVRGSTAPPPAVTR